MSNLSEFIGGGIKSVQSGTTNLTTGVQVVNETINAIDPAKSFACVRGFVSNTDNVNKYFIVEIVDSVTVRILLVRNSTDTTASANVNWIVVEYY
mgnify:CR=1 FL=1